MRLNNAAMAQVPSAITKPRYDRRRQTCGIVHFGIGAFHRAHMAVYTDDAMNAGDDGWAITGVSLRSSAVADQLNPQQGLYTLAQRGPERTDMRIIGAVAQVLSAASDGCAIIDALADPSVHIISFTITEKGYCRAPDGSLDFAQAGRDSVYVWLARGLAMRATRGGSGVTLLSCDNLADNGGQLRRLFLAWLERHDPALQGWVATCCTFPATMVDRIVPATTDGDRAAAAQALGGLADAGHVVAEPFTQWVIEDRFAGPRPRWEAHGAQLVADVAPHELAKLRLLNGAHSLLAYAGLAAGYSFVHDAVADSALRALARRLMLDEAGPTIPADSGIDLPAYANSLLDRFANPALNHRLIQIAMDGSQKIPQRWLATLRERERQGADCPAIRAGLAAWVAHLAGANGPVDDPLADELAALVAGRDAETAVAALVDRFGPLACDAF